MSGEIAILPLSSYASRNYVVILAVLLLFPSEHVSSVNICQNNRSFEFLMRNPRHIAKRLWVVGNFQDIF